jgi:hypothetical protein
MCVRRASSVGLSAILGMTADNRHQEARRPREFLGHDTVFIQSSFTGRLADGRVWLRSKWGTIKTARGVDAGSAASLFL